MTPTIEFIAGHDPLPAAPPPGPVTVTYGSSERDMPYTFPREQFMESVGSNVGDLMLLSHLRLVGTGNDQLVVGGFYSIWFAGPAMTNQEAEDFSMSLVMPDDPDSDDHRRECGGCGLGLYPKVFLQVPVLSPVDGSTPDHTMLVGNPTTVGEAAGVGAAHVAAKLDGGLREEYQGIKPELTDIIDQWWVTGSRGEDPNSDWERNRLMGQIPMISAARCEYCFPEMVLGVWEAWDQPPVDNATQLNFGYSHTGALTIIETVRIFHS